VSAPQKDEALQVLERVANERHAPFTLIGRDVSFERLSSSLDEQTLVIRWSSSRAQSPKGEAVYRDQELSSSPLISGQGVELKIPLLGLNQIENAATAYTALKTSGIEISDEAIKRGFAEVNWPARFQVVRREPPVVIDSAHNRDSALHLRETLDENFPDRPVIMVFCALEDKDISGMLEELKPRLERVIATRADHPRAPAAEWIAEQVRKVGILVEAVTPVASALERALELAGEQKLVLSTGSVAFAGEISAAWQKRTI